MLPVLLTSCNGQVHMTKSGIIIALTLLITLVWSFSSSGSLIDGQALAAGVLDTSLLTTPDISAVHSASEVTPEVYPEVTPIPPGTQPAFLVTQALTITVTPTPTIITSTWYFPLIILQPEVTPPPYIDPVPVLYCKNHNTPISIPDNKPAGVISSLYISDDRLVTRLNAFFNISHTWVGDLIVQLRHVDTGKSITLLQRPGTPATSQGCGENNLAIIFDDDYPLSAHDRCASSPAAISGTYYGEESLATFNNDNLTGDWELKVVDLSRYDTGSLNQWCLAAFVSENPPPPPPPPPPPELPAQARIHNISGKDQALPLDCESRVAVDWAAFFGTSINVDSIL